MKRLDEIEARLSAAAPGPWEVKLVTDYKGNVVNHAGYTYPASVGPIEAEADGCGCCSTVGRFLEAEDADLALVANAPADLRYLLDFAKAAKEALEFYAKPEHWAYKVAEELDDPLVHHDGGRVASEALALLESP